MMSEERKQAAILLCLLKIKYSWYEMDIIGMKGGETYTEEGPDEQQIIFVAPTYTEKLLEQIYDFQRGAMVIVDARIPYPESTKNSYDLPEVFNLDDDSLFDWMQAFCFLDYVSECDQLVKSYYSDLVKIKDYVGVRWVKSVGRKR